MLDPAPQPAHLDPVAKPFTSETARSAALLSAQSRARRKAQLDAVIRARSLDPAVSLDTLRARLASVDELIAGTVDPDTLDALTRAYERLFRVWQVLTRTPNPGQLRPLPERALPPQRRAIVDLDQMPTEPTVPAIPDGRGAQGGETVK